MFLTNSPYGFHAFQPADAAVLRSVLSVWRQTALTFGPGLFTVGRLWSESGLRDEDFRLSAACVCVRLRVCGGRRGVVFASVGCKAKPEVCCGCF